jgi:hypothetical protein
MAVYPLERYRDALQAIADARVLGKVVLALR